MLSSRSEDENEIEGDSGRFLSLKATVFSNNPSFYFQTGDPALWMTAGPQRKTSQSSREVRIDVKVFLSLRGGLNVLYRPQGKLIPLRSALNNK